MAQRDSSEGTARCSLEWEENNSKLSRPLLHCLPEQNLSISFLLDYLSLIAPWNSSGFPTAVRSLPAFPGCHPHWARPRDRHHSFLLVPERRKSFCFLHQQWECWAEIHAQPCRPCVTFAGRAAPKFPVPRAAPAPAPAALPGAPTGMTHPDRIATVLFAYRGELTGCS